MGVDTIEADEPERKPAKPVRIRLSITKAEARKMTRISRWEERSAKTCLTIRPPE